ncbi:amino acid ABC transporter substrate-binding protein [Oscillochloris sp. ZM17-4]|uniref:amino acid ABC transporter substrate-binding protein n=1 Tax=Oscillochloris sp. ZM17-4 TaxID=2866714 RepID=UPI001C7326AB|nr:amino acid ABC transporter substrate-binding protein [Oscillochloris sp. ZM17-4]MBX0330244.1 amino acid ABC transporter substrate-binding protein [Oscillochloris sp. ZM17-4]
MKYHLIIIALILLSACAPITGGTEPPTITIGAAISLTGKTFKEGEYVRDGYQLWVEAINAQGGLLVGGRRHPVRLIYYDDESRPQRTAELVERLIVEDGVDFLVGPYASEPTAAAAEVAERHRVPMVEPNGAAESIFHNGYRYTFGLQTPAPAYLRGIIDLVLLRDPAAHTVAIIGEDESFSREVARGAAQYAGERGMRVVSVAFYPPETQDVSPWLTKVKGDSPDLLLGAGHLQDALLVVRQARAIGLRPRAMGFSVGPSTPQFRRHLGSDADYILGATQWTSALAYTGEDLWGTPAAYADAFRARYPQHSEIAYQAAESTAALVVLQRAIEQVGRVDREAVRDALAATDMMTFFGRVKFDARGANVYKPMAVEQLHPDGMKYTVFPIEVAERAAIYPIPAMR